MYKKNKNINVMADMYTEQIRIGKLSNAEFLTHVNHRIPKESIQYSTHFISNILVQVGIPDLYQYTYKIRAVDNLISIINHQLHNTLFPNHPKSDKVKW